MVEEHAERDRILHRDSEEVLALSRKIIAVINESSAGATVALTAVATTLGQMTGQSVRDPTTGQIILEALIENVRRQHENAYEKLSRRRSGDLH